MGFEQGFARQGSILRQTANAERATEQEETDVSQRFEQSDNQRPSRHRIRAARPMGRRLLAVCGAAAAFVFAGCTETDAWLWNPSVVGRWEDTPTIVPVLERIDVIENDTGDFVEITQVSRDDLIPQPIELRSKAGDAMRITILDFPEAGRPGEFDRVVDQLGYIDLPMMPRLRVGGLSGPRIQAEVERRLVEGRLLDRPVVQVELGSQEEASFRVFGVVEKPGQFRIPGPDYRLLQALTDAGGVSPVVRKVYVIRQVSLAEELKDSSPPVTPSPSMPSSGPSGGDVPVPGEATPVPAGEDLLKVIDDLTSEPAAAPEAAPSEPAKSEPPKSPGAFRGSEAHALDSALSGSSTPKHQKVHASFPATSALQDGGAAMIDLPDSTAPVAQAASTPGVGGASPSGGNWVFINGEWVRVVRQMRDASSGLPEAADPLSARSTGVEDILTQRVIEIPVGPLLQGAAQYNLVIRPGDIVNVPAPEQGFVYAEGPGINRVGVYALPQAGQLTIQRLVAAAGGLSEVAIPERVDITRRVGDKRQATVRLNLRAIYEGTQPDIVLKSDDLVNFGTNFWATPMAIIRNGFRMTYGFGFLLDRNWGSDVFGVPPESRARGFN